MDIGGAYRALKAWSCHGFHGEPVAENGFTDLDALKPGFGRNLDTPDDTFRLTR